MKRIAITGVTLTGNMGGVAMLQTAHAEMSKCFPGAHFFLLSITPHDDCHVERLERTEIIAAPPLFLIGLYLPLSIILWPFLRLERVRRLLGFIAYFDALRRSDLVVDLCGIAFVDGRGLPLLLYNLACCIPAIAMGVPVAKLSQALGPFRQPMNRLAARFALSRCNLVIGRGEATGRALKDLGLVNTNVLPDVTFCLEVPAKARDIAKQRLTRMGMKRPRVIVSPSEVVRRLVAEAGRDLEQELLRLLHGLANEGVDVLLLAHSYGTGFGKNNDVTLCRRIAEQAAPKFSVPLLDDVRDPVLLRSIIGEAELFIGCRFHAVVAALAMGVPALTIGWSHKYTEMSAMFGLSEWVIPAEEFTAELGLERWRALQHEADKIRNALSAAAGSVETGARKNFELAARLVEGGEC